MSNPKFKDKGSEQLQTYDYVVANPPFSDKTWSTGIAEGDKPSKTVDKGWICDLLPRRYIVAKYFGPEQKALDKLTARLEAADSRVAELEDEHGSEDGVLDATGKTTKTEFKAKLKEAQADLEAADDAAVLQEWLELVNEIATLKKRKKEADSALDKQVYDKYPTLTSDEIQSMVINDKWLDAVAAGIHEEMDSVSQVLTVRLHLLAERYSTPVLAISGDVSKYAKKVKHHLERMRT